MTTLNILSGGAAQGLVGSLAAQFKQQIGLEIGGDFGAVGAMADKLRAGQPTDILVLSSTLIATLAREGHVAEGSIRDVGRVETALAVRENEQPVVATDAAGLRAAFLAADAIFVADTKASTAGIHVAKVLQQLGITDEVASRLKVFPNGMTAMRNMVESDVKNPIGCTQTTEILATKGVKLSGSLPKGCDLATVYTAAVTGRAAHAREAQILIDLLTAKSNETFRAKAGFLEPET